MGGAVVVCVHSTRLKQLQHVLSTSSDVSFASPCQCNADSDVRALARTDSASEGGHDRQPTVIPDRHLLQYFAPAFRQAFDAGVATVMNAYTEINGEAMASSRKYLVRQCAACQI